MAAAVQLMKSFTIRDLPVRNRIALAPMTRARAGADRVPTDLIAEYYVQRAQAGLIITEATSISEEAIGWNNTPSLIDDAMAAGWRKVVERVHAAGTPIFSQLWHCGRASHSSFRTDRSLPVSASAVAINGDSIHTPEGKKPYETPRALETAELPRVVRDFKAAAVRARSAGFDGIELHGANGYLIDQFFQSRTNLRTDGYGGSIENRARLLREIVAAVTEVFPANRVALRISPNGVYNDMGSPEYRELFLHVAGIAESAGLAYLHVMDGLGFGFHQLGEPMTLAEFRAVFTGPIIGNCGYTKELAEERIGAGHADLIAFGRPFISNPDLPTRFAQDLPLAADAPMSVWYAAGAEGYTDFPKHAA